MFCGRLEANHEAMNHSSPWSFRCEGDKVKRGGWVGRVTCYGPNKGSESGQGGEGSLIAP